MKSKKMKKKLSLNKISVADLDTGGLQIVRAGRQKIGGILEEPSPSTMCPTKVVPPCPSLKVISDCCLTEKEYCF